MASGRLYNLAKMNTATSGTGTITLSTAVSGFLTFELAGVSNGEVVTYIIEEGANRELGYGTYTTSGTTLTRNVLKSTNSDAAISLSGAATVGITAARENFLEWFANIDANGFNVGFDDNTGINDDDGNETVRFRKTSSAVNYLEVLNTETGVGPRIAAAGDDTNINLRLAGKGTGELEWNGKVSTPRERLTANRTYYVRTDGSNSNNGLANTSGGAFLTIQKAVDTALLLDSSGFSVTISVADGTYTGAVSVASRLVGDGSLTIQGNTTTPANCILSTSGNCFSLARTKVVIRGFTLTSSAGHCIEAYLETDLATGSNVFGTATSGNHIEVGQGSYVTLDTNYTISGGAVGHIHAGSPSFVTIGSITGTISGTPAFSSYFIGLRGSYLLGSLIWSGSATGRKYLVRHNAVLDLGGGSASSVPGSTVGVVERGGLVIGAQTTREVLTTSTTFYVRSDGNNANTGRENTAAGAFLTIQGAYNNLAQLYDFGGQTVTIQVQDGTWTAGLAVSSSWVGGGALAIQGNTGSPSSCVVSTTSSDNFSVSTALAGGLTIQGFRLKTTTSGTNVRLTAPARVVLANIDFNGSAAAFEGFVNVSGSGATVVLSSGTTITGGGGAFLVALYNSVIQFFAHTITVTGTPAFSWATANAFYSAVIEMSTATFSGSATGTRYQVSANAVINTSGGGASYYPGNASGTSATGGQYL
jgi:hypothetical protein